MAAEGSPENCPLGVSGIYALQELCILTSSSVNLIMYSMWGSLRGTTRWLLIHWRPKIWQLVI